MPRYAARAARAPSWAAIAVITAVLLTLTSTAGAHPLGNFTVNRYARLEAGPHGLGLVYIVDYAEIPTFQAIADFPGLATAEDAQALARDDADGERLARDLSARWSAGLHATLGDVPLVLTEREHALVFIDGLGGLPTMKLRLRFEAPWPRTGAGTFTYEDRNEPDRLGWREIVVEPTPQLLSTDPALRFVDRSRELTTYPTEVGAEFPQEIQVSLQVVGVMANPPGALDQPATVDAPPPATTVAPAGSAARFGAADDRFARLVTARTLTPELILISLLIAFTLGGFHALSPGHGKTIVAAYLVGARGTARHAFILSAVVTISHTVAVFVLGFVTLALSARVLPERLYPWIQLVSGVVILVIGLTMAVRRLRSSWQTHDHGGHSHAHEHSHGPDHSHGPGDHHHHDHTHPIPDGEPTMANLLALGISGGIVPCPSALVVLLSAIALHRVAFGLVLIVAFSLGLASVLCAIGILVVRAGSLLGRFERTSGFLRRVPALSALLVTVLGFLLVMRSVEDFRSAPGAPSSLAAPAVPPPAAP